MKTKLNDFWNLVVYYRKNGVEELEIKLGLKQRPQITLENILLKNEDNEFMSYIEIDNEIDNEINNIDFIDIDKDEENKDDKDEENKNKDDKDDKDEEVILNINNDLSKKNKSKSKNNNDNLEFLDLENNEEEKVETVVIKPSIKFKKNIMVIKPDDDE